MFKYKNIKLIVVTLSILTIFFSCEDNKKTEINLNNITFSIATFDLNVGDEKNITANVTPAEISLSLSDITLKSSDPEILTISFTSYKSGVINLIILAKKAGTVTITLTGKGKTVTATVNVNTIKVKSINLNKHNLSLNLNETFVLTTNVLPKNATDTTVTFTSNGILVNADGKITANQNGEFLVIATSNSDNTIKDTCKVYVGTKVSSVNITKKDVFLKKGTSQTIAAAVTPTDAVEKGIIWSSDNNNAVTVNENGLITGVEYGTAKITATSVADNTISDFTTVAVAKLTINKKTLNLIKGGSETLNVSFLPDNFSNKNVTWTSDNISIATIDPNTGKITALSKGTANIIAISNYNSALLDTCVLTITKPVESVQVSPKTLTLKVGNIGNVSATVLPSDASDLSVTWSSNNTTIATVNSNTGEILAISAGTVKIIATSNYGDKNKKDTCDLIVEPGKVGISLDRTQYILKKNSEFTLNAIITIVGSTNKTVVWSSDNLNIATVSSNGLVRGISAGTVNIIATANADNNIKDTCKVTVIVGVTSVKLNKNTLNLDLSSSVNLTATIEPADATDQGIIWASDNNDVATVSSTGEVQSKTVTGVAIISATSKSDNTIIAKCTVNVFQFVKSIELNKKTLNLGSGDKNTLTVNVLPITSTNKNVIWSSEKETIATVTNGEITAGNTAGQTKIYVTSVSNPDVKDSCTVTVYIKATGMTLSETAITLNKNERKTLTAVITPSTVVDKSVTWTSGNTNIATVNVNSGEIIAVSIGDVDIIATSVNNPSLSKICKLTVISSANEISIDKDTIIIEKNESTTLIATISPLDATNKTVNWTSSNPDITVVNGLVTGNQFGEGYVYATTANGLKDSCKVIVKTLADLLSFKFEIAKNAGMQQEVSLTNYNTFGYAGDFKYIAKVNLIPTFKVSPGAVVKVNNVAQVSGETEQDFTSPVYYTIISRNNNVNTYRVSLNFINDTFEINSANELFCKREYISFVNTAIIADSMNGNRVSVIRDDAFYYALNNKLTTAFNLKALKFPNSLKKIGSNAFNGTQIVQEIIFPNGLDSILEFSFYNCYGIANNLILPNSVVFIGKFAFAHCSNLKGKLIIPNNLKVLEDYVFKNCYFSEELIIPNSITKIKAGAFYYCSKLPGTLSIPSSVDSIGQEAFGNCTSFDSLYLPNSIKSIENDAFNECTGFRKSLIIPTSVLNIGNNAFYNCSGFSGDLYIPSSVIKIGDYAFQDCTGFSSIKYAQSTTLGTEPFKNAVNPTTY